MTNTDMQTKKIHQGRNIKRFREMLGIKQEALAFELGDDWNQKKISLLEQKETVESDILEHVAKILKIPTEAIENFDEEQAVNIIASTINNHDQSAVIQYNPTFYPIDQIIKLHEEKIELYERMLKEKDEMMTRLERLMEEK
ncbi:MULTISPECIES: helix-turn-helix domain-containing protein [Chryseobacterium]|uniref:helix-turn-helix domain-containing protein n=1 Tax=Chryseobacterium TaxID=59732 RepID=UPI001BE663A8|nr:MULTISPECIES: helix-turn-helix transcriptional regulator [Chryseobacterium]MBT2619348.1 helix-turn-helix transcriptional regulator [Chryseobacterium sp. ISL-6]